MKFALFILLIFSVIAAVFAINRLQIKNNIVAASSTFSSSQKPVAVRYDGKYDRTYISWITNDGKIQIRYFDHDQKKLSDTQTVDNLNADFGADSFDDRNSPSLLVLPDGKLQIYYGVYMAKGALFAKTTVHEEDINSWTKRRYVGDEKGSSYGFPQAKMLSGADVVLFYRKGAEENQDEYYKVTHDFGQTWGKPNELVRLKGSNVVIDVKDNNLHVAWDRYYIYSPDGGITWHKSDGRKVSLPANEGNSEMVFDPGRAAVNAWDIVIDEENRPMIAYTIASGGSYRFLIARHDGSNWTVNQVTTGYQSGNDGRLPLGRIVIDQKNPTKVFLSNKRKNFEVEMWETFDDGKKWYKTKSLTDTSAVDNFWPQMVENYSSDLRLIWDSGTYEGNTNTQRRGFDKVNIMMPKRPS